jgi:hypothetical protein
MAVKTLTAGRDLFVGGDERDIFYFCPADLSSDDQVSGNSGVDFLIANCAGTITAAQLSGVSGIEILVHAAGGNTVTLTNQFVGGTERGNFAVEGGSGDDTVDASGVTNGVRIVVDAGAGNDTLIGGNGDDYFAFRAADLTAADRVSGGTGFDCLFLDMFGSLAASAFENVSGIDALLLRGFGNPVVLTDALLAGADNGVMCVVGSLYSVVTADDITNGIRIAYDAGPADDTFFEGNGSDYVSIASYQLTSSDVITGGANYDIIEFSTPGPVTVDAFAQVSGIDALILHRQFGNGVTLTDGLVAGSDHGVFVVNGGAGDDVVDAGAVVASRVVFLAGPGGSDSFTAGAGSDVALFAAGTLDANDRFIGGAGFDVLQLTTAGTVGATAFTKMLGVDELYLTLGGNTIALGHAVANSDAGMFVVYDEAGHNVVDASAATLGGRVVFNAVAGDHNTYTGGAGSDSFQFGDASLNSTDTLAGGNGTGTDFLAVTNAASVTAADLVNVTQMEVVQLAAGGAIALTDDLSNSGSLEADGTSAADTIDGAAVASYGIVFKGNGSSDTLIGGAGNDWFFVPDTNFVAIDGNAGFDKIVLTAAFDGQALDLSSQVSKITDVEAISLESAAGAIVNVAPGDIAQINASANYLYLVGGSDDEVSVSGSGWTQLETNHTNANLPGHTLVHYHNTNGADLYLDSLFPLTVAFDSALLT